MNNLLLRGLFLASAAFCLTLAGQTPSHQGPKTGAAAQATPKSAEFDKPAGVAPLPTVEKPAESGKTGGSMPPTSGAPTVAPPPDPGNVRASARRPYIIGPEDILSIRVWQEPNLSGPVTVGPDGMISMQLIDEVKADGLTPEQLKGVLTEKLKSFIVNPDVNVLVLRVNSRKFIIQGEVNRPGSFPLTGPTPVMEGLVNGGGFREFAKTNKIYILRTELDPKTGKPETKKFNFNYKEVSHGKRMEQNILIQNGDQIFVP